MLYFSPPFQLSSRNLHTRIINVSSHLNITIRGKVQMSQVAYIVCRCDYICPCKNNQWDVGKFERDTWIKGRTQEVWWEIKEAEEGGEDWGKRDVEERINKLKINYLLHTEQCSAYGGQGLGGGGSLLPLICGGLCKPDLICYSHYYLHLETIF